MKLLDMDDARLVMNAVTRTKDPRIMTEDQYIIVRTAAMLLEDSSFASRNYSNHYRMIVDRALDIVGMK